MTQRAIDTDVLRQIESRLLWLATAIVHHANRVRPNPSGVKVGGHQASSASMVTHHDRAVVRALLEAPTACRSSRTPRRCCTRSTTCSASSTPPLPDRAARVRRAAELPEPHQGPGPGRLLDRLGRHRRDRADLGRARPPLRGRALRGAAVGGRQIALLGDAELDEGAVWEAVVDPMVPDLGEVLWVVDLNRQSLDRVVPDIADRTV